MSDSATEIAGVPRPGEVLMGKYRIERILGVGGMGAVVEARHIQLEDRVAIKFLLASMAQNEEIVGRFVREGRAAARIRNEHVVRVFDVGTLDSGAPYMVMEFLEGNDLAHVVLHQGKLPMATAVDWLLEACEAIAEAHAAGIVHRDLKPANLFVTTRSDGSPTIKVLDFGISKVSGPDQQSFGMTKTQAVMGSPRYMSPEQMRSSRSVDARSDVWALGTVLYEMLAGIPPFDAETMPELCARILTDSPPRLRELRPDLPPGLEDALLFALQKDPQARYQNVAQLAAALAPYGSPAAATSVQRAARLLKVAPGLSQSDPNARLSGVPAITGTMPIQGTPMFPGAGPMGQGASPISPNAATAGSWVGPHPAARSSAAGWVLGGVAAVVVLGALAAGALFWKQRAAATAVATTSVGLVSPAAPPTTSAATNIAPIPDPPPSAAAAIPSPVPSPSAPSTATAATATASSRTRPSSAPAVLPRTTPSPTSRSKPTSNPFEDR